ncbi:MAG TPA: efflux RND transporter permease subunit [Thiobacillus sp.]|nr:MAG: multidrug transporter AcrB [Hydrogenophilales bacterium 16-64-40]OZA33964.1 MAG: multidrug transporter AcrB [Hydrogenophilales bacterium 17-64-65]HQS82431.1 efflux RND transporter permease subunit [Thiobacillus sp.]HQT33903.1 efflux RND transporter permease subunit [Thiobacillus sp.]
MILSDISIRRPVLATVMSLLIILVGLIAFDRLPVREYPNIDAPVVSVRTVYPGASAEVMESQITKPLEDSLSGIEGIRTIKSVSREEVSQITVEFVQSRDPEAAANDARDRVARVRGLLPDEADDPVVAKIEADAQAIIWLAFSSDRQSALEITDYADRVVADQLKTLPGVASVIIGGERRYAMRLWLDPARMAALGVTVQDVETALRSQNTELPSGRIESQTREFSVLAETDLRTPAQFERVIIRDSGGVLVRLADIGRAEVGAEDERNIVRVNGRAAVGLGIVKQSTANTLAVAQAVKAELPQLEAALPEGMQLKVGFDSSIFIEKSIDAVYTTMIEAMVLVVAVIFLFLRNWRTTLIPFVTIPVSLIGAFIFLYSMGFTINVLTLLGLVLAIGLVVDDAIVMLENIYRHIENGEPPYDAAIRGAKEIGFAVVAMTMTLVAVFAPLAFAEGNTGKLFTEFALTVAAAVLVSGFVALTLTPMMASRMLRHETRHGALFNFGERMLSGLNRGYTRGVTRVVQHPLIVTAVFVLVAVAAFGLLKSLKSELAPTEDRGFFIGFMLAPEGSTLQYTDQYARQIEGIYQNVPEVNTAFVVVAPGLERPNPVNTSLSFVMLKPWEERSRSQMEITESLGPQMFMGMPGVLAFPINPPSLGQSFRNPPLQFVVQAPSYAELDKAVEALMEKVRAYPGLANADTDLKLNKPQLKVDINRDKAAQMGVGVDTIGRTLETLLGGREVTRFKQAGEQYNVVVQLDPAARATPQDLTALYVRGNEGSLTPLANLVTVTETVAPKELNHFDRQRAAIISANIAPGYTLGEALAFMEQAAADTLPPGTRTALDGQSREFGESGQTLAITFALALVIIYLVLAAQFESFVAPFIILLTVPLAATGALLALKLTGATLNVYSQIGLIMLVGLITKHGILIVEFANQLRDRGMNKVEAVIEAASLRLRPILMTTAAMVLGAVPLAIATGAGAESRSPIGWVIVGGLLLGTLLTLFVIPVAYTLLTRERRAAVGTTQPAASLPQE